jgi:hypothetical protein
MLVEEVRNFVRVCVCVYFGTYFVYSALDVCNTSRPSRSYAVLDALWPTSTGSSTDLRNREWMTVLLPELPDPQSAFLLLKCFIHYIYTFSPCVEYCFRLHDNDMVLGTELSLVMSGPMITNVKAKSFE